MKSIQLICTLLVLALICSCSSNDDGNNENDSLNNYTTECENGNGPNTITGPKAAYWDNAKGVPLPLTQPPLLANMEGYYIHNSYPAIGFPLPQGYSGFDIYDQASGTFGVDVKRNDNKAVWTYIPTTSFTGNFTITDAITLIVNKMFSDVGFNGNSYEVECSETQPVNLGGGVTRIYSARLIRFGDFTGQVYAINTTLEGLVGITYVSAAASVGPTNEYNSLVANIFIPLNYQLLVNDNGLLDSDLDGVPDVDDAAPNNPNIQ
ncbi:hypothetical protein [Winogradskyella thalassocola]|uniref:Lipoprotein n=1 Tax=Winogradskyella thalassocola TaxID=262004 RepID=A0A1G8GRY6_9FLAO|nr:hypothetical protein [Winogradskyella thalassocola]SDH97152.1 hypothetical protein SAMN04489796_10611 [Winogradskyella thalassocola]